MISAMGQNLSDKRNNIKAITTPYVPKVVRAIYRFNQIADSVRFNESFTKYQMDALMKQGTGLYYDWDKDREFSSRGHYFKDPTDLDSLLFLVTLINTAWPCIPPMIYDQMSGKTYQLTTFGDWPCYTPELTRVQESIFLQNDHGEKLFPSFVSGGKNHDLTTDERLFVMFHLSRDQGDHFFKGVREFTFYIDGIIPRIHYKYLLDDLFGLVN